MAMHSPGGSPSVAAERPLRLFWLELTYECMLECTHCYAGSGPGLGHGPMTGADWERVIGEAAGLGAGRVVVIGGEPTLHPGLPRLVRAALAADLAAEVYTNMVHIPGELWELFALPGVSLATSWYTTDRDQHRAITGRDTYRQTRANIGRAVELGVPLRAGVIGGIVPGQRAGEAEQELRALGVGEVSTDQVREFGRGTVPDPGQCCGQCGRGVAAVLPDGSVTPCPLSRWLVAGSVLDAPLGDIVADAMPAVASVIPSPRPGRAACVPDSYCNPLCSPGACKPRI